MFKTDPVVAQLRTIPGLADLPKGELTELVGHSRPVSLPADWTLIPEGTPADAAYLVLSGELKVCKDGHEVARLGAGKLVGEVALLKNKLRTASVMTTQRSELLRVERADFDSWLDERPALRDHLLTLAAGSGSSSEAPAR